MNKRPWLLAELSLTDIRARTVDTVVLPFGATEPHNLHLPYGTDTIEAELVASTACRLAHERGANVLLLPTIPYGTETNQQAFPFALNVMPSTLLALLRDLLKSLETTGVRKCVVLNSHGGNDFKGHLRELFGRTKVHLFLCNWYQMCRDKYPTVFEEPDDHAGEMETSLILYARPDLVDVARADAGVTRQSRFQAVREGWVQISRPWHLLTTNSGSGNPKHASAEKGARWLEYVTRPLSDFLVELSTAAINGDFPFEPA